MLSHRLRSAVGLNLRVQARHLFPQIYLGLTVLYTVIIRLTPLRLWQDRLVPIMVFSEPGMMGMLFVGAQLFFERSQGSHLATAVTPLREAETVLAKALAIALLATVAGLLLVGLTLPPTRAAWLVSGLLTLAPVLLLTSVAFALAGVAFAARSREFVPFLVTSQMAMLPAYAPLVALFGLVDPLWVAWLPSAPLIFACRRLFAEAALGGAATAPWQLLWLALPPALWALVAREWARRSYLAYLGRGRR